MRKRKARKILASLELFLFIGFTICLSSFIAVLWAIMLGTGVGLLAGFLCYFATLYLFIRDIRIARLNHERVIKRKRYNKAS